MYACRVFIRSFRAATFYVHICSSFREASGEDDIMSKFVVTLNFKVKTYFDISLLYKDC